MIAKRVLGAVLAALVLSVSGMTARAQDTPTEYAFDVIKIELCTDSSCTTAVVLGEGSQRFDLAAIGVGASAGSFISSFSLAANQTYTHLRVTHSRAITMTAISAGVNNGGGVQECVTGGTVIVTASGTNEALAQVTTTGAGSVGSQVFVVPDIGANNAPAGLAATYAAEGIVLVDATNMAITKKLTAPFTTGSSVPAIDAAFDVANTITFTTANATDCFVALGVPSVTITIQ